MINIVGDMTMLNCGLCNSDLRSIRSLSKHIRDKHEWKSKEYYDVFIEPWKHACMICGSAVEFINLSRGYRETCSHTCACTLHRKRLSADNERNTAFKEKISKSQTDVWKNRTESGESILLREKIGKTIATKMASLTPEERQQKYGWMNKLSDVEKAKWINEVMVNTGAHTWWITASDEEKQHVINRRAAKLNNITVDDYVNITRSDRDVYYAAVYSHTEKSYATHKHLIDPNSLRSAEYHLDHKYSIFHGFREGIDPEIIGSYHNLELLSGTANMSKGSACSITVEQLMEEYHGSKLQ